MESVREYGDGLYLRQARWKAYQLTSALCQIRSVGEISLAALFGFLRRNSHSKHQKYSSVANHTQSLTHNLQSEGALFIDTACQIICNQKCLLYSNKFWWLTAACCSSLCQPVGYALNFLIGRIINSQLFPHQKIDAKIFKIKCSIPDGQNSESH